MFKEIMDKLKLRSRGSVTCIYDKNNVWLREFNTIKDTAYFCGLSPSRVSKYIAKGVIWNNTYEYSLNLKSKEKSTKIYIRTRRTRTAFDV